MIVLLLRRCWPTVRLGLTFDVHLIYQKLIEDKSEDGEVPLQVLSILRQLINMPICHVMMPEKEMSDIPP